MGHAEKCLELHQKLKPRRKEVEITAWLTEPEAEAAQPPVFASAPFRKPRERNSFIPIHPGVAELHE